MNYIYLDTLFFVNFITDYIILLCTAKLNGTEIRRKHIALAASIGGIYACLCSCLSIAWMTHPIVQLFTAIVLCRISFQTNSLCRCVISFSAISASFGGILSCFTITKDGANYLPINTKVLFLTFTITYFILTAYFKKTVKHRTQSFVSAEINMRNHSIFLNLLDDSGNELVDPITNKPVIIVERKYLLEIIPELSLEQEDVYTQFCLLNKIDTLKGKIRLIPYHTISEKSTMLGFIPNYTIINGKQKDVIIASANVKLSQYDFYQGIC